MSTHLFGDSDEFEQGFTLGALWQILRGDAHRASVIVPTSLSDRAVRLAAAVGYRVEVRTPPGLPGLRYLRFTSTRR